MAIKPRNIRTVIGQVLKELPVSEKLASLRKELTSLDDSCKYTAPEQMPERWGQFSIIVGSTLNWPTKFKYEERIAAIMRNDNGGQ